jgi:hypothetical protein
MAERPPGITPETAVVGIMMASGEIKLAPCEVCPYRQILCSVCVVPSLATDPDIEENQFPLARGEA